MSDLELSAPWITYVRKISALFEEDPEIRVEYNDDEKHIELYVENEHKADALTQLLPVQKVFGNIVVTIDVIPANKKETLVDLFRTAFKDNPALSFIETVDDVFSFPANYIVFKNEVVQYFNDNLTDIHGIESTLYEDIAREIFENKEGIFFCTDLPY